MTRSISFRRPITGSSSSFFAKSVRSRPNAQCRCLDVFLRWLTAFLVRFRGREIWIELFEDLVACAFDVEFKTFQNSRSDSLALSQKSKQNMFCTDVRMIERLGFLTRERQYFFDARSIRNVADHLGF